MNKSLFLLIATLSLSLGACGVETQPAPSDTTPPTVTLNKVTTPLTSNTALAATAQDDVAITRVEFYDNGILVTTDTSAPFEYTTSYKAENNGEHVIQAVAYDAAGHKASAIQTISVNLPVPVPADTTAPTANLVLSSAALTTPGTVTFVSNAADNVAVKTVAFYDNDVLLTTLTDAPFNFDKVYTSAGNGPHTIKVVVTDTSGNTVTKSASLTVSIPTVDTVPDPFTFAPVANQPSLSRVTSNTVTVSGISAPTPISSSGGTLLVNGRAGNYTSVKNGDTVAIRLSTAEAAGGQASATVKIGEVSSTFVATTGTDTSPNPFNFFTTSYLHESYVESAPYIVSGLNAPAPITSSGHATVFVNGNNLGVTTVKNGDVVTLRQLTDPVTSTGKTTVKIGDQQSTFSIFMDANRTYLGVSQPLVNTKVTDAPTSITVSSSQPYEVSVVQSNNCEDIAAISLDKPVASLGSAAHLSVSPQNAGTCSIIVSDGRFLGKTISVIVR